MEAFEIRVQLGLCNMNTLDLFACSVYTVHITEKQLNLCGEIPSIRPDVEVSKAMNRRVDREN